MTFKYYAVMQGEVVDKSNSLTNLMNRMDEYVHSMPSNMGNVYIVTGKKNPLIVKNMICLMINGMQTVTDTTIYSV